MHSIYEESYIIVAAHRGYRAKYPENTPIAFQKALELEIDMIEMDLNLTKDKQVVVIHDQTVDRTTNGIGYVRDKTLEEIKQLDAGSWFDGQYKDQRIPTLIEFCELIKPYPWLLLNVEIKERTQETVDLAMKILEEYNLIERCVFTCFDATILHYMSDTYQVRTQGFPDELLDNYNKESNSLEHKLTAVGISMKLLTKELVESYEEKGILPWSYCPDREEEVERSIAYGVKLMTCNDPVPALKILKQRGYRNTLNNYIKKELKCKCGKKHEMSIEHIVIREDAIEELPSILESHHIQNVLVVADNQTYESAGAKLECTLKSCKGLSYSVKCFKDKHLVPNEKSVGEIMVRYSPKCQLIIALGTGTINDLCKYTSFKLGIQYIIVATAPSMDGFASTGAALIINDLKTTFETHAPLGIIGDINVLRNAPLDMIRAGIGDIVGKYTCLCDWKIAHLINEEYHCMQIVGLVEKSIAKCVKGAKSGDLRDPEVIYDIMEALILTGIAMSFVGNSRPASGSEHHLSHFWEMKFLFEGKQPVLHGTKVAIGTVSVLKMYEILRQMPIDFDKIKIERRTFEIDKWKEYVNRVYNKAARGIILLEEKTLKNDLERHSHRLEKIKSKWDEIVQVMNQLPKVNEIETLLNAIGLPINPQEVGVDEESIKDSIILAKEVRERYTILQLLWDLNKIDKMASYMVKYFKEEQELFIKKVYENKRKKLEKVKCFILDMDGTIYLSNRLFEFTKPFLEQVKQSGKEYVFLTNNSSKNAKFYREKLNKMGIVIDEDKIFTSNQVIIDNLKSICKLQALYVVGTEYLIEDFKNAGFKVNEGRPEYVVIGFDTTLTYDKIRKACDYIREGIPVIGVNTDYNCPIEGGFIPDCGSISAMVTASTGEEIRFFGKPAYETLSYILKQTGYKEEEVAFIGDRLYTDINICNGTEAVSILVLTGETKLKDLKDSSIQPDLICESLEEIKEILSIDTI